MDIYHKFGSRWFCLRMLDSLNEQCLVLNKLEQQADERVRRLLPLISAISGTAHAIGLLRGDCLLNDAYVLARLLSERVITVCCLALDYPTDATASVKVQSPAPQAAPFVSSAMDLVDLGKSFRFVETYDSQELERKLAFLETKRGRSQ